MVAILVNPNAGKGGSKYILSTIRNILTQKSILFSVYIGLWPEDYNDFSQIWLIGGDGTLNYFVNNFDNRNLPMALFKGGTGNDFAWKLYGNCSIEEQVMIVLSAKPQAIDAGICNGKYFLNTLGIGFDGKVLKMRKTIRWLGGTVGYYLAIIKIILSYREKQFSLSVNGAPAFEERFLLVLISNSPRTGGGFMVSPFAEPNDGILNLITCKPLTIFQRLRLLPLIRLGKHIYLPSVYHVTLEDIVVHTDTQIPAQLDGELIIAARFDCSIIPGRFLFLY